MDHYTAERLRLAQRISARVSAGHLPTIFAVMAAAAVVIIGTVLVLGAGLNVILG